MTEHVQRTPIKIRKAIRKEFCSCWDTKILSINNTPQLILADNMKLSIMEEFYKSINSCIGVYFSEPIEQCRDKILLSINYGIPVTIKTNTVLPPDILKALQKVPHSAIHISTEFLKKIPRNSLDPDGEELSNLRKMLYIAKAWKIFLALHIEYMPYVINMLDLLELVEMYKMFIKHLVISFPTITDTEKYDNQNYWDFIHPGCVDKFKQYYQPIYETRSWSVKDAVKRDFMITLGNFIKAKKLTMEEFTINNNSKRVKHIGETNLPLGMKPFFYAKLNETQFIQCAELMPCICPKCGKDILS